ncbi:hypothetical protein GCK32_009162 [Trichostrongylus colubriformis]|uniref:Immunoglobulin I-set domain-containing protein n=1 Tax=Trichostrongylus colubriformis TaxID=6319 RepID=A0AAN8EYZ0_TRICO
MLENRMLLYTNRKGMTRLNIMRATPQDSGEYTCEAINPSGKDFTHSQVQVIGMALDRSTPSTSRCPSPCIPSLSSRSLEPRAPAITRPLKDVVVSVGTPKPQLRVFNKFGALESIATLTVEEEVSVHLPKMPIFTKKLQDVTVKQVKLQLSSCSEPPSSPRSFPETDSCQIDQHNGVGSV